MEEIKSNAGQGLGVAGLILGILAVPMGIIPCTFFLGILFGLGGIVMSAVALSQASRWNGPKTLIIVALVCSIMGFTFAAAWGVAFSSSHFALRELFEDIRENGEWNGFNRDWERDRDRDLVLPRPEEDTVMFEDYDSEDLRALEDTLRALEEETP